MKRLFAFFLVIAAIVTLAAAQPRPPTGGRWFPQGTLKGQGQVDRLIRMGQSDSRFHAIYQQELCSDYDQPGKIRCVGKDKVPAGAHVPGNYLIDENGKIDCRTTLQRTEDTVYFFEVVATGKVVPIKSCGQPCKIGTPPPNNSPPVLETDFETEINIRVGIEINTEANATSTANATGGNAVAQLFVPQSVYVPQIRWIATITRDTYETGSLTWQPQVKINNSNWQQMSQKQQQEQLQWQMQIQEQIQDMQQRIDIWIREHGGEPAPVSSLVCYSDSTNCFFQSTLSAGRNLNPTAWDALTSASRPNFFSLIDCSIPSGIEENLVVRICHNWSTS